MPQTAQRYPIPPEQIEFAPIRAQGPGGQNVNKVASAVQLRFDVHASSLPEAIRQRLLALGDRRIGADGVIVIKAQAHRSQAMNRADALRRLEELVARAAHVPTPRRPTRPGKAAIRRRLEAKAKRSALKSARRGRDEP